MNMFFGGRRIAAEKTIREKGERSTTSNGTSNGTAARHLPKVANVRAFSYCADVEDPFDVTTTEDVLFMNFFVPTTGDVLDR